VQIVRRRVKLDDGTSHALTEREAGILTCLARHPGEPIGRDRLLREVWGLDPDGLHTRTVDMHVARLREKLGDDPADARVVVTVRARGYMLGDDVQVQGGGATGAGDAGPGGPA